MLGENILLDWFDGVITSPSLVSYTAAAKQDGLSHPILERLSVVGGSGPTKHAQNGLCNVLMNFCGCSASLTAVGDQHCILPSTYLNAVFTINRTDFTKVFCADTDKLMDFRTKLFSSPEGREMKAQHPHLHRVTVADLAHTIPVVVHEDGAPYTKKSSCNTAFVAPLISTCSEHFSHLPVTPHLVMINVGVWKFIDLL